MLNQDTLDRIEDLKHTTYSNIKELQTNLCPMVKDIYLNYQFEYWYDGYKYNIWEDNVHLYAVNEIPYCYDNEIKNTVFMGKLNELIEQDKVWPFLLFVNGAVVRWSDITIIHDYDYSYLRIDNIAPDYSFSTKLIYFPIPHGKIRYGEDNDYSLEPNVKGIYFNSAGFRTESPEFEQLSVRFEIFDDNLYFKYVNLADIDDQILRFDGLDLGFVPTLDNIVLFYKEDGSIFHIPNSDVLSDSYNSAYGMFRITPTLESLKEYPIIALLMYNTSHSKSSSHIYIRDEDLDRENIKNFIIKNKDLFETNEDERPEDLNEFFTYLLKNFDFQYEFGESYLKNTTSAANTITKYDFSLWNKIYIDNCPIKSFTYTGLDFKKLSDDKGYVHFSRKHTDLIEDVAMMFVNSKLYANSIDISYVNNTINLPIFGILDDDHVEVVLFTKCNNNILDIDVKDEQTPVYIHPEYNLEDCYIMSEECSNMSYPDTPESPEHRRQFICEVQSYDVDDDSNYKIKFANPDYYGTELKIVPKHQFRYYRFTQRPSQFKFILPTQFNYCHDINRYMIFVNGKKIDRTEFTITIMNQYRPFDKLVLYLSTILDEEDYIDVFYLPEALVEAYKEDNLEQNGYVFFQEPDNYPKLYSLSKYTSMVFVNGLKVNPLDIKDVHMNGLLINQELHNIHNVTILEYMDGCKDVAKYLYGMDGISSLMGDTNYLISDEKDLHRIEGTIYNIDNPDTYGDSYSLGAEDSDFSKSLYDEWKYLVQTARIHSGYTFYVDGTTLISTKQTATEDPENPDTLILDPQYYEVEPIDESDTDHKLICLNDPESVDGDWLEVLFGKQPFITDIEKNYKEDYAPLRAILYDVVVDYYFHRQNATTGVPFVYEFEAQEWYPNDSNPENLPDGWIYFVDKLEQYFSAPDDSLYVGYYNEGDVSQTKIITLYPDHDKLLDYYYSDKYASTDEVLQGKEFIPITD